MPVHAKTMQVSLLRKSEEGRGDRAMGKRARSAPFLIQKPSMVARFVVSATILLISGTCWVASYTSVQSSRTLEAAFASIEEEAANLKPFRGAAGDLEHSLEAGLTPSRHRLFDEIPLHAPSNTVLTSGPATARSDKDCNSELAIDQNGNSCIDLADTLKDQMMYYSGSTTASCICCAIPKNGCTYQLGLLVRLGGEQEYQNPGVVHSNETKAKYLLSSRSTNEISRLLRNDSLPKYAIVRNPVHRTLSAYLDKVERHLPDHERTKASFARWVFQQFPVQTSRSRTWSSVDPHWRPQTQFCGFQKRDVHSYLLMFRVEEPEEYLEYLYKSIPNTFLSHGWGRSNSSFREYVVGPHYRTVNTLEKFDQYFTLDVFDHLVDVLSEDISRLGYKTEVSAMRERLRLQSQS